MGFKKCEQSTPCNVVTVLWLIAATIFSILAVMSCEFVKVRKRNYHPAADGVDCHRCNTVPSNHSILSNPPISTHISFNMYVWIFGQSGGGTVTNGLYSFGILGSDCASYVDGFNQFGWIHGWASICGGKYYIYSIYSKLESRYTAHSFTKMLASLSISNLRYSACSSLRGSRRPIHVVGLLLRFWTVQLVYAERSSYMCWGKKTIRYH